ncbi:MAG TPA: hypothetical protein VFH26_00465 [Gemmatimonadales bacterium]|nr:hypothetical protein [Gemmatimonadales bacterium]
MRKHLFRRPQLESRCSRSPATPPIPAAGPRNRTPGRHDRISGLAIGSPARLFARRIFPIGSREVVIAVQEITIAGQEDAIAGREDAIAVPEIAITVREEPRRVS